MITWKLRFSVLQLSKTKLVNFRRKEFTRNITPQKVPRKIYFAMF